MFPLFELAKLLNFSAETQKTEQAVTVRQIAWKEVGDRSFLALLFSNGYLLLRYTTHGSPPVVRQLPWHPDRPIQSMTFDPSATWLLCVTAKDVLYVVPALALMDSRARIEQLWKLDDITRIKSKKRRGQPTCLSWWVTSDGDHVAVVGTKLGYVLFVNLQNERVVAERDVNENVSNIEVLRDEARSLTHALITTKSNSQWKILLEKKGRAQSAADSSDIAYMGFENININVNILHYPESQASEFLLKRVQQFSSSTFLTPVNIKGKPMVAARDLHTKQLQIYDSTIERSAQVAYLVPEAVQDVLVTDRLLFFTSTDDRAHLQVVATRLNEVGPTRDEEDFNTSSIVQSFKLGPSEHIVAVFKRSFPFYWHEKREEEKKQSGGKRGCPYDDTGQADSTCAFRINQHTVLDGCVLVTTQNVYECRPRVSPEALFVDIAVNRSDQTSAERLAVSLGLDVNSLHCLVAQLYLSRHNYRQASRFFQLAKSPHLHRVGAFAEYGRMSEVVQYLRQTLDCKQHELRPAEVEGLSDMMVLAYVQQLLDDRTRTNELAYDLREFLKTNAHYSKKEAIDTLVNNGFYEIALAMAKVHHCLIDVLERILGIGGGGRDLMEAALKGLPHDSVDQLVHSSLLQYLSPADLIGMLEDRHSTAVDFMTHFETLLDDLDLDLLGKVTQLFDISLPPYRKLLKPSAQQGRSNSNNNDDISLVKSDNHQSTFGEEQESDDCLLQLANFFARCVILLNKRRGNDMGLSFSETAFIPFHCKPESSDPVLQYRLPLRQRVVSAGRHHSGLIHNGLLHMWGDCFHHDRPGKEKENASKDLWRPYIPIGFQTILVRSVSCGAQHSMAITDDGVYGWGDCRYGQLGIGQSHSGIVRKPQRVSGLGDALCVDIVCGNYHTVSIMEDCSVYTWGWGIHGQLGHGDAGDRYLPTALVPRDDGLRICEVAAGYAHTLLLTEKGSVYACGSGVFGQLGLGTTCKHPTLQHIKLLPEGVIAIATKDFHCLALTSDSKVYQWGASPNLLCDHVRDLRQGRPRAPPPPASPLYQQQYLRPALIDTYKVVAKIIKVECGSNFSSLLTEDGEVFTWGRNYDGQLGIGNRVDQKCPVMVNRINDRRMAAVTCGADHMVVMDTDQQVWCWGRNDLGQLAVVTSQGAAPQSGQGIYVAMGIYAAVWPTKVPSLNRITGAGPRNPLSVPRAQDRAGRCHVVMPTLAPYSCDALFSLLQHLPDRCSCGLWLQQSLDHQLWGTAASLALHQSALPLALHCHLSAFSDMTKEKTESDDVPSKHKKLLQIAEFYLSKLEQMAETNYNVKVQTAQDILCQIGEAWVREKADVALFMEIINKHLLFLAWPFFLLMTRTQPDEDSQSEKTPCAPLNLPRPLVASLSVPFCLRVTHTVVQLIQQGKIPEHVSSSVLHGAPPATLEGLQLLPPHRMISADKLWEEIFYNVHKEGSEAQTAITLSGLELEALTAATGQGEAGEGRGGDGRKGPEGEVAVVFSCGHHMPRRTLTEEAVPQLEQELGEMDMPQSADLLSSHYSHKGTIPLACPKCVLNTIKSS